MSSAKNPSGFALAIPFLWATIACLSVVTLMWPTAQSIIEIWSASETFTHGYFVVPAFAWLVWSKRDELAYLDTKTDWRALLLVLVFGAFWLLCRLSGIQVGEHVAFVLILICTLWAVLGKNLASAIQFPLLFLLFLAPVGEELVPVLMQLTADMTAWAIRITGIPIYREGLFFSLPSGNWSVVEACSGIRYLIASLTLGTLYAYLNYASYRLRVLFIVLSVIVPIFANSVRAYIIVMLGHFSDNKLATGVDHLIYGWVFFGIVMFVLFSIGSLLKAKDQSTGDNRLPEEGEYQHTRIKTSSASYVAFILTLLLSVALWPTWATAINSQSKSILITTQDLYFPQNNVLKQTIDSNNSTLARWQPIMSGYDRRIDAEYGGKGNEPVRAMAFVYVKQEQGKEMINSMNVLVKSRDEHWRTKETRSIETSSLAGITIPVTQSILTSTQNELIVWQWYEVGNIKTANPIQAKLLEMVDQLLLRQSVSVTYILVADKKDKGVEKRLAEVALGIINQDK